MTLDAIRFLGAAAATSELSQTEPRMQDRSSESHPVWSLEEDSLLQTAEVVSQNRGITDESLLEQIRLGRKEALGLLFRRHARAVRHVAYRILRNEAEAEDLVQEVFVFVYRKAALFDPSRGGARSWIFQAAYHRAIDRRRYLASRHFYTSSELEEAAIWLRDTKGRSSFYEDTLEGTLGEEKLRRMWEALSEDQRQVLELHFFSGDTLEEAAVKTGQTVGNIRNHYYRGLEKLRKQIFSSSRNAK